MSKILIAVFREYSAFSASNSILFCSPRQIWTNRLLKELDGIDSRLPPGVSLCNHDMEPEAGVCKAYFEAVLTPPASTAAAAATGEDSGGGGGDGSSDEGGGAGSAAAAAGAGLDG